jgi:4-diphosphocytidyl-2-C-methyl-D-erythritol kinase
VLTVRARAKINLGLEVTGRRPDGFHDIVTILQEIDLADVLTIGDSDDLILTSNDPSLASPRNLVLEAARLLRAETGARRGAAIHLDKKIPVAAGLGGGSSDAAAALKALNRWWCLGLGASDLTVLAARLGSDVPFFVGGGTQLAMGRGDVLSRLPMPRLWLVLVPATSAVEGKTRQLYAALDPGDFSDGREVRALATALQARSALPDARVPNTFTRAARQVLPEVGWTLDCLAEVGAAGVLSGAGPTVFTLHDSREAARDVAARLRSRGLRPVLAATAQSDALEVDS